MGEVHVRTGFGVVVIPYSNLDELGGLLDEVPDVAALVQRKLGTVVQGEPRKPKPGFEQIYRFGPNGRLEFLKRPGKKVALVALALYAYDPDPVATPEIEAVTGVANVIRYVLTPAGNKKYFTQRVDGTYTLSPFGFQWIANKVVPGLK